MPYSTSLYRKIEKVVISNVLLGRRRYLSARVGCIRENILPDTMANTKCTMTIHLTPVSAWTGESECVRA